MVSFIIPLLVILLSNLTSVYIFRKKFSKVLIFTLLFFAIPVFISGIIFSTFKIGIIINIIYSLIGIVLLIKNRNDKNKINEFKDNYFNTGLFVFLTIYIFVYIYDLNRTFTMWDEKSHWGVMLKEMIRLDNFYSIDKSTLMVHKDYPPIIQLFELFWIKLCGSYKEAYAIRALHTLELSFIIPFIKDLKINIKNIVISVIKTAVAILIIMLTILMFDSHRVINSIYNDYLLSIIVVYSLFIIFIEKELLSIKFLIHLSLILVFLLLTKQVSISFYMMILFFYILKILKEKKSKKDLIKAALLLIIIPLTFLGIWNVYIKQFDMEKQFVVSDIRISELKDIITNSNNSKHIIYTNYIEALKNYKISFFKFFDLSYLKLFLIFSLIYFITFIKTRKTDNIKLYITILIGMVGYALLMLLLYLFSFGAEGYTLASFDRYMDTYVLIEYLLVIFYIIYDKKIYIQLIISFMLILIMDRSAWHYLKPAIVKNQITNEEIVANDIIKRTEDDSKIFLLAQDTGATYQFSVKYYANPRITNLKGYELPIIEESEDYFYNNINDYMLKFDYLYVVNTTEDINNNYDFIFKSIKNNELYKINDNKGKVTIKKVK